MRCITSVEASSLLALYGFEVAPENSYRTELFRPEGNPPRVELSRFQTRALPYFVQEVVAWLPDNEFRLFWIQHDGDHHPRLNCMISRIRVGFGEFRPIAEAPGHLFPPNRYCEQDQTLIDPQLQDDLGLLVGLVATTLLGSWEAKLVSAARDFVDIWEGNICFYSEDPARLDVARSLAERFDLHLELE